MTKLLEIVDTILNEELLGTIKGFEVFKNPKSINRMGGRMRGISDKKGDLYVVDDSGLKFIHAQISDWLGLKGFISKVSRLKYDCKDFIYWERLYGSNTFALSGTYDYEHIYYGEQSKINKKFGEKLLKKVKSKNSKYDFVLKNIRELE